MAAPKKTGAPARPSPAASPSDSFTDEAPPVEEKPAEETGGDGSWASAEPAEATDTWATTLRQCPHCSQPMIKHEGDSPKQGAWHCDSCGGCFVHRGSAWFVRDGHPPPLGWEGG